MKTGHIALIGSGYWGKNLARVLYEKKALGAICDTDARSAGPIASAYGVPLVATADAVLALPAITGVCIAAPAVTHFALTVAALRAGKDVYVEKPLALDIDEAKTLSELAVAGDRVLMVGHLLQYHPVFRRLMSMTAEGRLGRIDYIYSHRLNLGKIRREENVLWSFAPHDISMILALAGQEPDRVAAFAHAPLDAKIADIAVAHLHFPSGMRAHLFVSWLNPFKEQKLTVIGDEAMAVFDDGQPWESKLMLYRSGVTWRDGSPVADKTAGEAVAVPQSEPLGAEIDHFLDCVATRASPRTDAAEAIRVLSVLKRAETAIAEAAR